MNHLDPKIEKRIETVVKRRVVETWPSEYQREKKRLESLALWADFCPSPVLEIDACGEITFCNRAAEEFFDRFNIDSRQGVALLVGEVGTLGKAASLNRTVVRQYEIKIRDRFLAVNSLPAGSPGSILIFAHDVTGQRLAERERELLKTIIKTTDVLLVYLDTEFNIVLVNPAYADICKMEPEEMIGSNYFALSPHSENEASFRRVRDTGEPIFCKDRPFIFPNQPERRETNWDWSLVPAVGTEGQVVGLVLSLRETTGFKRAERALADSEKRFRTLAAATFEGIAIIENGRFVDVNDQLLKIYGCDRQDVVGHSVAEFMHPEDRERVMKNIYAGRESHVEHELIRKDGSLATIEAHGQTIISEGRPIRFKAVRDITDRKRAAEERQKVQRIESLGLLAGGIAHDFNNLLTVILGNITLARKWLAMKSKAAERLTLAEQASIRAQGLSRQLLTFAKGGAPIKETLAAPPLIEEAVEFALRGSKVKAESFFSPDLRLIEADRSQLNQVVNNLAINAVQAMPEGGLLTIVAANVSCPPGNTLGLPAGGYLRIDIKDQGQGIAEEDLDKIFDPYFTTKELGSGLGLSISFSIVKRHEGTITVDSSAGEGSTFSVFLPASEKKIMASREETPQQTRTGKTIKGRILVMDDEETVSEIAAEILRHLGYRVETVDDGKEAITAYRQALAASESFDVVIVDLTVPAGMGGRETLRHLLAIDPAAKVIVSSGYVNDPSMADYGDYGFKGVISKPYKIDEIAQTLREVLGG